MAVLKAAFLAGPHWVTVEKACPPCVCGVHLDTVSIIELGAPVRQEYRDIFFEELFSQAGFEEQNALRHIRSLLVGMVNSQEKARTDEFERLDERTIGNIVVNGIHLHDRQIRILGSIGQVVLECTAD